jgi:dephospho-CoA kinase
MVIIGITGTIGAGKGTIVDYLVKHAGFVHFSVRSFLTEEIIRQNLPVNRDSMVAVANKLREEYSPSYIVEELYKKAIEKNTNSVIESIRSIGEVEALKAKKNFYLFSIDADPKIRYNRICGRDSETDCVTYERFLMDEAREMLSEDPSRQNLKGCIEQADFRFVNNGSIEELYNNIKSILKKINLHA